MVNLDDIFLMIKPWAMDYSKTIIANFDNLGSQVALVDVPSLPRNLIMQTYSEHITQFYFEPLVADHENKPSILAIYSGNIFEFKDLKLKLRIKLSPFIQPHPLYDRNALHSSETREEFEKCIKIWGSYFG